MLQKTTIFGKHKTKATIHIQVCGQYNLDMKISTHLPQFNASTLIVVAGKQEGVFFLAHDGKVEEIDALKLPKPTYTDREGQFMTRGNGKTYGTGAVYESDDDETTKQFIKKISDCTTDLVAKFKLQRIYLFCPTYLSNQFEASLPKDIQSKIEYIFYGNYHRQHPFVLLSKVQEYLREETARSIVAPIKGEAANLLSRRI